MFSASAMVTPAERIEAVTRGRSFLRAAEAESRIMFHEQAGQFFEQLVNGIAKSA